MTRSEMVLETMQAAGARVTKEYPVDPRRKTGEKETVIYLSDWKVVLTVHRLVISKGQFGDVYYDGFIPPTKGLFLQLLSWLGLII